MLNCGNCLYQGDRIADKNGNCSVFCLIRAGWFKEDHTCGHFREHADIGKDIRIALAGEIRHEEIEARRLKKIVQSNWIMVLVTFVISFLLFIATIKFFDSYIF